MTRRVPILMYHSVTDHPQAATRSLSARPPDLESQLRHLRDNGFTGLAFTDLAATRRPRAQASIVRRTRRALRKAAP